MDLLIGIAIGSIVANIAQSSKQSGGTVEEEKKAVQNIVQSKLKYPPHIGRYINSFMDRVQPRTNDELRKMVKKWCETPDTEKPLGKDKQHISKWDTSLITDMSKLFTEKDTFNDDISQWDTSNVTDMSEMFCYAESFNKPISNWNTSKVTDMSGMFYSAISFNQPIGNWNTSKVTNMLEMFDGARSFNQPINTKEVTRNNGTTYTAWDTSNVTDMGGMFYGAESFNQPIGNWDTSNVNNMDEMFDGAESMTQLPAWYN